MPSGIMIIQLLIQEHVSVDVYCDGFIIESSPWNLHTNELVNFGKLPAAFSSYNAWKKTKVMRLNTDSFKQRLINSSAGPVWLYISQSEIVHGFI